MRMELPDVIGFEKALDEAIKAARRSPCFKVKRGAALWRADSHLLHVWGVHAGHNSPPKGFACADEQCQQHCAKVCVHAEQAVLNGVSDEWTLDAQLLHVKLVDDQLVASGAPTCWQCSRQILAQSVGIVWLLHDWGWTPYPAADFHEITLRNCGLPVVRST